MAKGQLPHRKEIKTNEQIEGNEGHFTTAIAPAPPKFAETIAAAGLLEPIGFVLPQKAELKYIRKRIEISIKPLTVKWGNGVRLDY